MFDCFNRRIDYLRISVTDRCDLRCVYCMPENGVRLKSHEDILPYEQIEAVTREAVALGVTKVRLTGGEPLVRRGICGLVERLGRLDGIRDFGMTTNGTRLKELAPALRAAGLHRVNVSLDTLDPDTYRKTTRGGDIRDALAGIDAARDAGLVPIKINMVVTDETTVDSLRAMQAFCERDGLVLQKIMRFSLYDRKDLGARFHVDRPPSCTACNRIRLTADGYLKPCLFSENEIRVDFDDVRASLVAAIRGKPEIGSRCRTRAMCQIGG